MTQPISELPAFLQGFFIDIRDVLSVTAENVKERMSETGTPSISPVQWDGEKDPIKHTTKQQRWWFANHDGPYERNGAYERSWVVDHTVQGATLHAPHPAGAIGGMASGWQSRIHRGRWNNLLQVLFDELGKIPDAISNRFSVRSRD